MGILFRYLSMAALLDACVEWLAYRYGAFCSGGASSWPSVAAAEYGESL